MGLMTAWMLRRQGWQVTVYDQAEAFAGSSWAGGGIISPVPPWSYPLPVRQLVAASLRQYPELVAELHGSSGIDPELIRAGLLYLGPFDDAGEDWRSRNAAQLQVGRLNDWLPGAADLPAWQFTNVAQVRNPRLGQALLQAAIRQGVVVHQHSPVRRIHLQAGQVTGLELRSGELQPCRHTVLAAGAWSDIILRNSGLAGLGIKPLRGQMLLWQAPPGCLTHMVTGHGKYLIPRRDGHILGGSTVEDVGFDNATTAAALDEIQHACRQMFPLLKELTLVRQWSGLRPAIAGDIPVIGPMPDTQGLWLNTGHYRNGLGMAPASCELLVSLMTGTKCPLRHEPYAMPEAQPQARPAA